eukprot:11523313-Alexandrium_andersonii.AAC.1
MEALIRKCHLAPKQQVRMKPQQLPPLLAVPEVTIPVFEAGACEHDFVKVNCFAEDGPADILDKAFAAGR